MQQGRGKKLEIERSAGDVDRAGSKDRFALIERFGFGQPVEVLGDAVAYGAEDVVALFEREIGPCGKSRRCCCYCGCHILFAGIGYFSKNIAGGGGVIV